jgi:hypothetical protein
MRTASPRLLLLILTVACLTTLNLSEAKKPDNSGGGGGGGGGAAYTVIAFAPDGVQFDASSIWGLNDAGDVVGNVTTENGTVSYHLDLNTGSYTSLPGIAWAVNDLGEIVGTTFAQDAGYYLSTFDAVPVPLEPLTDDLYVSVNSINNSGIIVGTSTGLRPTPTEVGQTAVAWRPIFTEDGTVTIDGPVPLLPLDGYSSSSASDINDPIGGGPFEIVGGSDSPGSEIEGGIWTIALNPDGTLSAPSDPVSLGTLDGSPVYGGAINSLGDVCGSVLVSGVGRRPIFVPFDGPAQPLEVVRNTTWGTASDINDLGVMVGTIETVTKGSISYRRYGYIWEGANSDPVKLENLIDKQSGWGLYYAHDITNDGLIAGKGYYDHERLGFIMVPAP